MRKLLIGLLITGSLCLTCAPRSAIAGSGEVAAGVVGGLAVGTLFGAAVASPRYVDGSGRKRALVARMLLDPRLPRLGWGIGAFGTGPASKFVPIVGQFVGTAACVPLTY
jgi:hypothetical protein